MSIYKLRKALSGQRTLSKRARKHEKEFIEAIEEDDMEQLRKLTKDKIKMLATIFWNDEHVYPIHIGCAIGSLDVVKFLFRLGCTLETKTETGMTALHFSSAYNVNHPEVTAHLLDMGAKPSVKDKTKGYTPFHYASENNNFGAAKRLLESTKRFLPDNNGKTAKDIAIENDCEQIVALFEAYDEECKQKEELLSLPGRIESLEKRTEFLLKHNSLQSINDSGVDGSDLDFHTSGQNLVSLHLDNSIPPRSRRLSNSSLNQLRTGSRTRLASITLTEEQFQSLHSQGTLGITPAKLRLSFSTMNKETDKLMLQEEEEVESPQPLTRESPLGKLHRHQVVRHYSFLHSMVKPDRVIIKLFSKKHLDLEAKERLARMPTPQDKNDYILTNHILKGSMGLYEDFLQSLKDSNQEHIAERLNRFSESPLYRSTVPLLSICKESAV